MRQSPEDRGTRQRHEAQQEGGPTDGWHTGHPLVPTPGRGPQLCRGDQGEVTGPRGGCRCERAEHMGQGSGDGAGKGSIASLGQQAHALHRGSWVQVPPLPAAWLRVSSCPAHLGSSHGTLYRDSPQERSKRPQRAEARGRDNRPKWPGDMKVWPEEGEVCRPPPIAGCPPRFLGGG